VLRLRAPFSDRRLGFDDRDRHSPTSRFIPATTDHRLVNWNVMSTRGHARTTARRVVWLGAVGIVLAGLFGMHGLDSHGMPGMAATLAAMAGPQEIGSGGHEAISSRAASEEVSSTTVDTVTSGHPAMDIGMEVTCMAILALALLVLLRTLRGRSTRRVLWMLNRPARAPAFTGRDPDPPSLIALSIQRC
jgi:hypothetical protein